MLERSTYYKSSNHLGNVLTIINDVKIPTSSNGTTHFRQLDPRLGRWKSRDPVTRFDITSYNSFSNNPIIYIDPNGDTDYYNSKGKWIGTDGIVNGEKKIVLKKTTAKIIKKATRKNENISMNTNVYNDIIDLPFSDEIKALDKVFADTRATGNEQGFVVGEQNGLSDKILSTSGGQVSVAPKPAINSLISSGYSQKYLVHSHPSAIKYNSSSDSYSVSANNPSPGDKSFSLSYPSRQLDILLAYKVSQTIEELNTTDLINARKRPNHYIQTQKNYTQTITFYDKKGLVLKMDYEMFKSVVQKVATDPL